MDETTAAPARRNWTALEVAAIVAEYREIIAAELRGESVNKAARNLALRRTIARSEGSIEFKHQNISGVLHDLGLRFIQGYKPAANYQQLLADEVLRWLASAPAEAAALASPSDLSVIAVAAPRFEAPSRTIENERVRRTTVSKVDYASRDAANRELGRRGEEYILEAERRRLHDGGAPDLSRRVRWISAEDGDGAGYDIGSHELDGQPRLIEVKTTMGSEVTPFFITANELRVASERAEHYQLFRLHSFPNLPTVRVIRPPIDVAVRLSAVAFRAQLI